MDSRLIDLDDLVLRRGAHESPAQGACLLEVVSHLAGEPWSDRPRCVSSVVGRFLRALNDDMDDADRQQLKPLIPRLIGTRASRTVETGRSWLVVDWYCRTFTPVWMRAAGWNRGALQLEALPPVQDGYSARAFVSAIWAAHDMAVWHWPPSVLKDEVAQLASEQMVQAGEGAADAGSDRAAKDSEAVSMAMLLCWDVAWPAAYAAAVRRGHTVEAGLRPVVGQLQRSALDLVDRIIGSQGALGAVRLRAIA